MYYHENYYNIRMMNNCHFDDANRLSEYLTCWERADPHQSCHLDLANISDPRHLLGFVDILSKFPFTELSINLYENENVTEQHVAGFMQVMKKQQHLRKLNLNLRWLDKVHDGWMQHVGAGLHHELEECELWIWNCKHVTDAGLGHLLAGLQGCKRLHTLKLYMGETGLTEHHSKDMINKFLKSRKLKTVRIVTNHMNIGCPKEFCGILGGRSKQLLHRGKRK